MPTWTFPSKRKLNYKRQCFIDEVKINNGTLKKLSWCSTTLPNFILLPNPSPGLWTAGRKSPQKSWTTEPKKNEPNRVRANHLANLFLSLLTVWRNFIKWGNINWSSENIWFSISLNFIYHKNFKAIKFSKRCNFLNPTIWVKISCKCFITVF